MARIKLRNRRGESIAETLISILFIALAFVILCGAVLTASRTNESLKNDELAFYNDNVEKGEPETVTLYVKSEDPANPSALTTIVSRTYNVFPYTQILENEDGTERELYHYYQYEE